MPKNNKVQKFDPLPSTEMRVSSDGKRVLVGNQQFKRTVLPSAAAAAKPADKETEALLDELETD